MGNTKKSDISTKVNDLKQKLRDEKKKNSITTSILEGGTLIIWAVDSDFNLISFNQNYFRNFLDDNHENLIWELVKGDLLQKSQSEFWNEKYNKSIKGESINFQIKTTINDKLVWHEVFLNPIYEHSGEISGVSGLAHDITEKMDSKIALFESEKMFRNIFESFQDLYFRCDFSGNILMLSPSVKDIMGYSDGELLGKNIDDYYLYKAKTKSLLRKLVAEQRVKNFELDLIHKKGKIIHCICNVRIIENDSNKPLFIEGVARDISELRQANQEMIEAKELAEESLKIKEQFLANMSHEIRTPLNGIIGMIHLLDQPGMDGDQRKRVNSLKHSSEILLNILNDLLDLSKLEAGKVDLKFEPLNTEGLIKKLLHLYQEQAETSGISIHYRIDAKIPPFIFSDETKLLQIMSNLVSNAIKFSHSGDKINIDLRLLKKTKQGKLTLACDVNDTGIGISNKDQKHLFSSFTQLDSSSNKAYEGTGLGLYISKELTKLFNGDIEVESEIGIGSTFRFTFETSTTRIRPKENNPSLTKVEGQPELLVVDDNHVNLELASTILKKAGCKITIAKGGKESIEKAIDQHFDLILMDIQMPDIDGVMAARGIRSKLGDKTPPIIAMTAYSMEGDKEKFLSQGFDNYIAKPIKPEMFVTKLKQYFKSVEAPVDKQKNEGNDEDDTIDHLQTINQEVLKKLEGFVGEEVVNTALQEFDAECTNQIIESKNSFDEKDIKLTLTNLHTLKGNAGTLGVERMAHQARKLEKCLKMEKYDTFEEELVLLKGLHEEFKINLNALINQN